MIDDWSGRGNWGEIPEGRGGQPDRPPVLAQRAVATPLVERAQWETDSGHPPGGDTRIRGSTRPRSSEMPGALAPGGTEQEW